MLIANLRSPPEPDDLQRDWRGMNWIATGSNWVSGSGSWAHRAILGPVARTRAGRGDGREAAEDGWQVLIDGTPCRHSDGTVMTWRDRLQAGCQAHELLQLGFQGPAMRTRTPWRLVPRADVLLVPCLGCGDGPCRRREYCIRGSLPEEGAADQAGVVIMDVELPRALQTIGDRACFDDEDAARHAYRSEVARWLTLT